jgi:ABC-type uncharacterized transport system ATPase subunit
MRKAELRDIHKTFETPGGSPPDSRPFAALSGVSIAFSPREIHTILGENGAGKSTLVNILSGAHRPSRGSIRIGGQTYSFASPSEALSAGIAMVHQRPLLSDGISVLENILLGSKGLLLRRKKNRRTIETLARQWNMKINLDAPVRSLTASERLHTALLSALYRKPDFLVLDEPSAILVPEERDAFFIRLRQERDRGLGIILITHKVDEAVRWSDRVSVLRRGKLIFTSAVSPGLQGQPGKPGSPDSPDPSGLAPSPEVTESLLEELLDPLRNGVGETDGGKTQTLCGTGAESAGDCFTVSGITAESADRNPVRNLSFAAAPGTITGIFGLPGSGIEMLEDILSGMRKADSGTVSVGRTTLTASQIESAQLRRLGVSTVPSDRAFRGSHPDLTIQDLLCAFRTGKFLLPGKANAAFAKEVLAEEQIDAVPSRAVRTLSGGQLQRLLLARCLAEKPRILVLAEPEWGLDIRSAALLRKRLGEAAAAGMTVIILTDDIDSIRDTDFYSQTLRLQEGRIL